MNPSIDESLLNLPLENRHCIEENEIIILDIKNFFLYCKLMFTLLHPDNTEINKYPLDRNYSCKIITNKPYSLNDEIFKNRKIIKVRIREKHENLPRILIRDELFFILMIADIEYGKKYVLDYGISFSKAVMNEMPEPRIISITLDGKKTFEIMFDDTMEWLSLKNSYEKYIKNCKNSDAKIIQVYIANLSTYLA